MILDKDTTQDKIDLGLEIARDAIGSTMGPGGNLVMYPGNSVWPTMTKDGATVAKHIGQHPDKSVQNGIMLAISASVKQEKKQGDGTTLTAILCKTFWDAVHADTRPVREVIREIDHDLIEFEKQIKSLTQPIDSRDELKRIATVSTNGDEELADQITTAIWDTGLHGHVIASFNPGQGIETKRTDGYVFDAGIQDREFANQQGIGCMLEGNVHYLITEKMIMSIKEIEHIIKALLQKYQGEQVNLVIISPEIGYSARTQILSTFKPESPIRIVYLPTSALLPRKASFVLADIAAVTGANIISDSTSSWKGYGTEIIGQSASFYSDNGKTIIFGTEGDITDRLDQLNAIMTGDNLFDADLAEASAGMIKGGLYEIRIGGLSESEILERRDRANDAILACKSAIRGGYIPGGGVIPATLGMRGIFGDVFSSVVVYPMWLICNNLGVDHEHHVKSVTDNGVFDPTDVVIGAYQNSWSVIRNALQCTRMIIQDERR